MAALARLTVAPEIATSLCGDSRAVICAIDNETISLTSTVPPTSTSSVQFSNLSTLVTSDTARFILYKLDEDFGTDDGKWLVISWIPDGVRVRDKMLYSSSRSHLKTTLGLTHFVEKDYNVSEPEELTSESYLSSLVKVATLNSRETALAAEKMSTASEGLAGMSTAMGVVPFTFTEGLTMEINDFKDGRKHFVSMSVEPGCKIGLSPSYSTITPPNISGMVGSTSLTPCVESDTPSFLIVRCVGKGNEPNVTFVYVCPEGSKVKDKMQASTAKSSVLSNLKSMGVTIGGGNKEVCESDEVDDAVKPEEEDTGATSKAAEITHKKPMRKGRGKARIKKFNPDE